MDTIATCHLPTRELLGPDLATLPPLADQLHALDVAHAGGDIEQYIITWLDIGDANGAGASLFWDIHDPVDAPADLTVSVHMDRQRRERHERCEALHEHRRQIEGFNAALERELVQRGRFIDNRHTSLIEIKAVVRAFLATDGRLMINTRHKTEGGQVNPAPASDRFLKADWSYADQIAARAMVRLCKRWKAQRHIERIVRALGKRSDNGFIILEGEGA